MTPTNAKWEEEFSKKFVHKGEVGGSFEVAGEDAEEIKSFIRKALLERERELIRVVEKWIEESGNPPEDKFYGIGEAEVAYRGYCHIIGNQILEALKAQSLLRDK